MRVSKDRTCWNFLKRVGFEEKNPVTWSSSGDCDSVHSGLQ